MINACNAIETLRGPGISSVIYLHVFIDVHKHISEIRIFKGKVVDMVELGNEKHKCFEFLFLDLKYHNLCFMNHFARNYVMKITV